MLLSDGSGARLWPLSCEAYRQQFARLHGIDGIGQALLLCDESSRFIAAEQLLPIGIDDPRILLEPLRRNTAPPIAAAALYAQADGDNPLLLVLPSDHVIRNQSAFCAAVGITPRSAQTGYGYICVDGASSGSAQPVRAFVKKAALAQASEYIVRLQERYGRIETPLKATAGMPNALEKCNSII